MTIGLRSAVALAALASFPGLVACGPSSHQQTVQTVEIPSTPPPSEETNVATDDAPPTHATPKAAPEESPSSSKGSPPITAAPDNRKSVASARARALVVSEVQGLTTLLASTQLSSPDRPQIVRRLAEDYVEVEAAALRDNVPAQVTQARLEAIRYYAMLETDHPSYPRLDEVYFYHAYEAEHANDLSNARRAYYTLIQRFPSSKYVPNAYLGFGEMFFNEAAQDQSKFDLAEQAYNEVLKYPPPANTVYGYASYKLAYVHWNKSDVPAALSAFKRAIDFGAQFAQLPGAAKLADAARKDIIPVYAEGGDPQKAFDFFHTMSGDAPGSSDRTFAMMGNLGKSYIDTNAPANAQTIYRDLEARDAAHHCQWEAHFRYASRAVTKTDNVADLNADIARCP